MKLVGGLAIVAAATLAPLLAGCNECSFVEQCEGSVRQICGDGVDHQIGREVRSFPCEAPNDSCVQADEDVTACVLAPPQECTVLSYQDECADALALRCVEAAGQFYSSDVAYVVAEDCAARGLTCQVRAGAATCV